MGLASRFLDLVYPPRCPLCQDISDGICQECAPHMKRICDPYCFSCGKQLLFEEEEYCSDCRRNKHAYVRGRAFLRYEGREKEAIHKIKYENKREYLKILAEEMADALAEEVLRWNIDLCVPIPMYEKKKRIRGFNQAEILAEYLGSMWEIPVDRNILKKTEDTGEQKKLSAKERRMNLRDAFSAGECEGLRLLLVDDVYTTGSTIDAASEVLMEQGAEAVYFVTICAGNGNN